MSIIFQFSRSSFAHLFIYIYLYIHDLFKMFNVFFLIFVVFNVFPLACSYYCVFFFVKFVKLILCFLITIECDMRLL